MRIKPTHTPAFEDQFMGTWRVDNRSRPGILMLRLEGSLSLKEIQAFVTAHNQAINEFQGADYRVFVDIREMQPLKPHVADVLQKSKEYSSAQENFRGSAVWVSSAIVALQHRRTSVKGGVMDTELISDDEEALWRHLGTVHRSR